MAGLSVKQASLRNDAGEHLFQAHRLPAKLQTVGIVDLGRTFLVFHGGNRPFAFTAKQFDPAGIPVKFNHIAHAYDIQALRSNPEASGNQQIPAGFELRIIMRTPVEEHALHRARVFRPLLLDMDQRPLPAAKGEVLDS